MDTFLIQKVSLVPTKTPCSQFHMTFMQDLEIWRDENCLSLEPDLSLYVLVYRACGQELGKKGIIKKRVVREKGMETWKLEIKRGRARYREIRERHTCVFWTRHEGETYVIHITLTVAAGGVHTHTHTHEHYPSESLLLHSPCLVQLTKQKQPCRNMPNLILESFNPRAERGDESSPRLNRSTEGITAPVIAFRVCVRRLSFVCVGYVFVLLQSLFSVLSMR